MIGNVDVDVLIESAPGKKFLIYKDVEQTNFVLFIVEVPDEIRVDEIKIKLDEILNLPSEYQKEKKDLLIQNEVSFLFNNLNLNLTIFSF